MPQLADAFVSHNTREWTVSANDSLHIGRIADVEIGVDDPAMHRVTATLWASSDTWWISNQSDRLELTVGEPHGRSMMRCGPQRSIALTLGDHEIVINTGLATHSLGISCDRIHPPALRGSDDTRKTVRWGDLQLGEVEREVLVALAEPWLRNPTYGGPIESTKSIRHRLGMTPNSFNHALDRMCRKLDETGIDGVRGNLGELATERRRRLIDHSIRFNIVTAADLPIDVRDAPLASPAVGTHPD